MHFTRFDFLKTYQKEKRKKKKPWYLPDVLSTVLPFQETVCPLCPSLEQLTQLRISFLQDEVPF